MLFQRNKKKIQNNMSKTTNSNTIKVLNKDINNEKMQNIQHPLEKMRGC